MVCQRLCLVSLILVRLLVWFRLCKEFPPKADMRLSFMEICCVTATNICLQLSIPIETELMLCSFAVSFLAFLLCLFGSFLCFALYLSVAFHCTTCPMYSLLYFRFVAPKVSFYLLFNSANLSLCSWSFLTGVCGLRLYCCCT